MGQLKENLLCKSKNELEPSSPIRTAKASEQSGAFSFRQAQ